MFAKTIIDSDAFLDMPLSTQCLYFHLGMRADDDGFVNSPKRIMRMLGCNDDELSLLRIKKFIYEFENGIVIIKHWKIHNYIQKDRYKESVHTKEKQILLVKENKGYTLDTKCIQFVDTGKVRLELVKDSLELGKDIEDAVIANDNFNRINYTEIKEHWNSKKELPAIRNLSSKRKEKIKLRIEENSIDDFKLAIDKLADSKFATGKIADKNGRTWKADIDWLIVNDNNIVKVLEGKYDEKEKGVDKDWSIWD